LVGRSIGILGIHPDWVVVPVGNDYLIKYNFVAVDQQQRSMFQLAQDRENCADLFFH
jgi:hypothetical protein